MKKHSDAEVVRLFKEAKRVAQACLISGPGLPTGSEIHSLACALLGAGLVQASGKGSRTLNRGAQDAEQDEMLTRAYGEV